MVTIATNMAGRGTDIVLGGNVEKTVVATRKDDESVPEAEKTQRRSPNCARNGEAAMHAQVLAAGGLYIIGSERHESRRIDNQLLRSLRAPGRPGSSRFYLSLDDPLLRIFAGERLKAIMDRLKMPEGEAIEHPSWSRARSNRAAQGRGRNFDIRKQLLEYDDVNDQRKVIYQQRNELLEPTTSAKPSPRCVPWRHQRPVQRRTCPRGAVEEQWEIAGAGKRRWRGTATGTAGANGESRNRT